MTTPDPDRKSAPFEWRALTINKVEKIQLARLHEEQDRIEKELREQEALQRAARQLEAKQREGEALEQAWFDEGTAQPRDTLDDHDTEKERAAFTPLKRLSYSLAAFGRRLVNPPRKPRSSVPPPPFHESPISLSLVLAACAFGGSVYLSLRWIAEVRQANVTHQLSSSVNATTPPANSGPTSVASVATSTPFAAAGPGVVSATTQALREEPQSLKGLGLQAPAVPTVAAETAPQVGRASTAGGSARPSTAPPMPAVQQPSSTSSAPQPSRQEPEPVDVSALPPTSSQHAVRTRVLVPAAGSPHSSGTRVYRGGE